MVRRPISHCSPLPLARPEGREGATSHLVAQAGEREKGHERALMAVMVVVLVVAIVAVVKLVEGSVYVSQIEHRSEKRVS